MASASSMDDLTCSVCLSIFTDPVSLSCGHSFCRTCATSRLTSQRVCPLRCVVIIPADGDLRTNHTLKNLADKAKEDAKKKDSNWVCSEHEEKLKLFCETDQQLVCVICRDGAKHDGHKFKPIKEAAQLKREELAKALQLVTDEISVVEDLSETQEAEMSITRQKSQQLKTQISSQFDEMHQFLKKREEEMKKELEQEEEEALKEMQENLESLKEVLSKKREREKMMRSDIPEPEAFLQRWTDTMTPPLSQSSGAKLKVVTDSISIGPYESHLQFFMWKEMLQVIKPLPEQLTLYKGNGYLTIANDGRSMFCTPNTFNKSQATYNDRYYGNSSHQTTSYSRFSSGQPDYVLSKAFTEGQHYWEVEVGEEALWELGVRNNDDSEIVALRYDVIKYSIRQEGGSLSPLSSEVIGPPRKIGVFFNFSTSELSFYNADQMKLIHTTCGNGTSVTPYFAIGCDAANPDPLKVCWY